MRIGARVFVAAALLAASTAAAMAEGPYDNSSSYWTRVERWQDCAWKAAGSPYPPAFSYGPTHSCAYGSQKVLLSCGLAYVGDIDLPRQTRNGAHRAPLFRITAAEASTGPR
jgi:hypothetical protein